MAAVDAGTEQGTPIGTFIGQLGPVWFLVVIFLINFISRIILSPLLPTIERELSISHSQSGFFFFLISIGYLTGLLGSGFIDPAANQNGASFVLMAALADGTVRIFDQVTGIDDRQNAIPTEFALDQNYPNPFNPTTSIGYALKENTKVVLKIYNLLGQEVRTLVNGNQEAGYKKVAWDGMNDKGTRVASGIYIYRIKAGDFVKARKMILMK